MKKLLLIGVALAVLFALLLPTMMIAQDGADEPLPDVIAEVPSYCDAWDTSQGCCQYSCCPCELETCCACVTFWFKVSYFSAEHDWVRQYVKAHDGDEAAELLGLRAGYNCFVIRAISYHGA